MKRTTLALLLLAFTSGCGILSTTASIAGTAVSTGVSIGGTVVSNGASVAASGVSAIASAARGPEAKPE